MIKNVVFDLGGVLIDWDPRYLYRKITDSAEEMEFFLKEVCHHDWNVSLDVGRSFDEALRERESLWPDYLPWIRAYRDRWPEMLKSDIPGTVNILKDIERAGYPLFALTNWSAETFPHALARFDFLKRFKGIVVSGTEKLVKPDPRIYQLLLSRFHLNASETLFIDDVEKNVVGARAVGMQAVQFRSPELLKKSLRELNVSGVG